VILIIIVCINSIVLTWRERRHHRRRTAATSAWRGMAYKQWHHGARVASAAVVSGSENEGMAARAWRQLIKNRKMAASGLSAGGQNNKQRR